jgi:hypothetical protein
MAIPWTQLDHNDAACVYRNLAHLLQQGNASCPFGQAACDAWNDLNLDTGNQAALQQWIEQYVTYDQWELLYAHCVSTPGKQGRLLDSLADAGKNKGLLT